MGIRVYNTLTKKKETFVPAQKGKVGIYVCGPTVYDSCHIGHARSVVVFDVIVRYFRSRDYEVTYIRNFTDVDDKIIRRANEVGMDTKALAEKYISEFYRDMDALHVHRADYEPRVTEHIDEIIDIVKKLVEKSYAYEVDGDVYFNVEKCEAYGKLSGRNLEDMIAGIRVKVNEKKNNPFDFALWKSAKPGEPFWSSPWGNGRPGWHIECSAMSEKFLGVTFDIHGGGKDLIFPHHENEIAQSESASGKTFATYWMHNGFVNINNEKMSKSLGNFLVIRDILESYHPESVRLFLLSNHYRSPIDFSDQNMNESERALDKLYAALQRAEDHTPSQKIGGTSGDGPLWAEFSEAMDDDFNTAKGIGTLFGAAKKINRVLDETREPISPDDEIELISIVNDMKKIGEVLGVLTESSELYFSNKKTSAARENKIDPVAVEALIAERTAARNEKNWAKADEIRDKLEQMNVLLEDRPDGTVWKIEN